MFKEFIDNLKKYKPIFKKCKKEIILLLLVNLIIIILSIISPALIAKIITFVINKKYDLVIYVILLLVIVKISYIFVSILDARSFLFFRKKFIINLKEKISDYVTSLDLTTFFKNGKGKFIQRLNNDPQEISKAMYEMKKYLVVLATNLGTIMYIFYLDCISGIIYFATLLLTIGFRLIGIKKKYYYLKLNELSKEKNTDVLTDAYNGIKDIKEFNLQNSFSNIFNNKIKKMESYQFKADFRFEIYNILSNLIEWTGTALFILVGVYLISVNSLSLDSFITIFMYRNIVFSFTLSLSSFINQLSVFNLASTRVFEVINLDNKNSNGKVDKDVFIPNIEFRKVYFKYDKSYVLKDCSFEINKYGIYSFVGKSAAGKTTICNLLTRLYKVNRGEILIDSNNINDYSEKFISNNISIVSQNHYLFNMSIKDNLLLIKPSLTDDEIINICKKVGLHNDIMKLSEQYDTVIGDGGSKLSGGQQKRLAIARTLLMDNKVIIFDEATSSLDSQLENKIFSIANSLKDDHIVIFISHNISLIKKIDNILIVENGKITDFGSHEYLVNKNKTYISLVNNKE